MKKARWYHFKNKIAWYRKVLESRSYGSRWAHHLTLFNRYEFVWYSKWCTQ